MKRILIADSDQNFSYTLGELLKAEAYDVHLCNDPDDLLHIAESRGFDLVLINPLLQTENGGEIISQVQASQPAAAFIVIHEQRSAVKTVIPRAFDHLQKPADFRSLVKRIRQLFDGGGFSGIIAHKNIKDYLQMFFRQKTSKAILIRKDRKRGIILIHDGRVVSANTARIRGEDALQEILSWNRHVQIKEVGVKGLQ